MRVLIGRGAARAIFDEVRRWVERGLRESGAAHESLLYPVSALVPKAGAMTTPLHFIEAEQIEELVIFDAAIPPDEIKAFTPANCHFAGDLDSANAALNTAIDAILGRFPRAGIHSKLHAHPFEGGAFLSGGDIHHGVQAPKALGWRQQQGLATAILHVVAPDQAPVPSAKPWRIVDDGAIAENARTRVHWKIHSWASVGAGAECEMHALGAAAIVGERHPSLQAARRPPYFLGRTGAIWCDGQKRALRAAGFRVSRNTLSRGWRRYLIDTGTATLVLAMPPDFPLAAPQALWVRRAWLNDFVPLRLPLSFQSSYRCSLVDLVRTLEAAIRP